MSTNDGSESPKTWAYDPAIQAIFRRKALKASEHRAFAQSDVDDIEQEYWLQLLRKLHLYDPTRASRETFASRIADNKTRSVIRAVQARKRATNSAVRLDESGGASVEDARPLLDLISDSDVRRHTGVVSRKVVDDEQLRIDVGEVTASAPSQLRILAAVLCHVRQFAAGQVLGLTRRQTTTLVGQLRALFEAAGFEPDVQTPRSSRM